METIENYRNQITKFYRALRELSDSETHNKPDVKSWSKIEILGHLCDSAINNYYRFMHLQQSKAQYVVEKYDQDLWVKMGQYQSREWESILNLWESLNFSILKILESNFEANKTLPVSINGTQHDYGFLVQDYYDHMAHHMKQIIVF